MNINYYSYGNPFKVKLREHYCYKCGNELSIVEDSKVIYKESEEAKYYDFSIGVDGGIMIGPCEFIHNVFYCSKCSENIEFITQINHEDIDIIIDKVKVYFDNKGRKIEISKYYENEDGLINSKITKMEEVKNLCIIINNNDARPICYKIPITRSKVYTRPYFFKVNKKQLIAFIKDNVY